MDLPEKARSIYKALSDHGIVELAEGEIVCDTPAVLSGKLHQIANGAVYYADKSYAVIHEEKLDALESYLEELSGKPTLVIYEFNHDLDRIQARFGDLPNLGAGISIAHMEMLVDEFNGGRIPVLLGHPGSMGHGLNLQQSCHHIIWFSVPWDLDFYDQTIARIYRQGQQSDTVYVYHIVARATKDDDIRETLDQKDADQQKLLRALG